jgi:DNA polymerase theta
VGVSEPYLMQMAHGAPISMQSRQQKKKGTVSTMHMAHGSVLKVVTHRVSKRFYVALMLSRLVQASSTC